VGTFEKKINLIHLLIYCFSKFLLTKKVGCFRSLCFLKKKPLALHLLYYFLNRRPIREVEVLNCLIMKITVKAIGVNIFCRRFANSCYHHQYISNKCRLYWLQQLPKRLQKCRSHLQRKYNNELLLNDYEKNVERWLRSTSANYSKPPGLQKSGVFLKQPEQTICSSRFSSQETTGYSLPLSQRICINKVLTFLPHSSIQLPALTPRVQIKILVLRTRTTGYADDIMGFVYYSNFPGTVSEVILLISSCMSAVKF